MKQSRLPKKSSPNPPPPGLPIFKTQEVQVEVEEGEEGIKDSEAGVGEEQGEEFLCQNREYVSLFLLQRLVLAFRKEVDEN